MPALTLKRSPFALVTDRAFVPVFSLALALFFIFAAWRYAVTIYAPDMMVIVLFVVFSLALLGVAFAFVRYAPIVTAINVSNTGAVTVVTTHGNRTVPAGATYGVTVVRFGVALKYRNTDGRDAWIGIDNGYMDKNGNHLSGYATIDRINAAIGTDALDFGRTHQAFNRVMLRAALRCLGFITLVIGAISAARVMSGT